MQLKYSIIVPVYNRPQEIAELLSSLTAQSYPEDVEVVIVEDGSVISAQTAVQDFKSQLNILYLVKENSGPGLSRNHGMQRASGNYFIVLDSDVLLPKDYLNSVEKALQKNYTAVFGGADAAHSSFTKLQKAINFAMTSFLTTGGLRGNKKNKNFQPRSFNMGLSKKAFEATGGFGSQHFGEDIDLAFRLQQEGFESQFIPEAYVYHKRRNTLRDFFKQTFNFGAARPILNRQHQGTAKITYWFPSIFILGLMFALVSFFVGYKLFLLFYLGYFAFLLLDSLVKNKHLSVALLSVVTSFIQFTGYGLGFLRTFFRLNILQYSKEKAFPRMFR